MTTPTEPGLLPCPLCRAPAKFLPAMGHSQAYAYCEACGLELTKEDAQATIAAWNTRPNDLLLLAVEALEAVLPRLAHKFACHSTRPRGA